MPSWPWRGCTHPQGAIDDWHAVHHLQLQSRIVAVEFLMSERPLLPRIEDTYETFRSALEQNELDVPCFDRDQLAGPVNLAGNLGWVVVTANAQVRRYAQAERKTTGQTLTSGTLAAVSECTQISLFLERAGTGVLELSRLLTASPAWQVAHADLLFQKGGRLTVAVHAEAALGRNDVLVYDVAVQSFADRGRPARCCQRQ